MGGKTSDFWVGLFVLGSLAAAVLLLLQLGGEGGGEDPHRYRLIFARDVSGLNVGAEVNYLGVSVGQVRDMALLPQKPAAVEVLIDVQPGTPVTSATYASLAYQGVTGIAVVTLADDPALDATALGPMAQGPVSLPTRDTGIAALLAEGPELGGRMSELLSRGNALLGDGNLAHLETVLDNLARASDALASQQASIAALPVELRDLLVQTRVMIEEVHRLAADMAPDLASTGSQLRRASADLAGMSTQMRALLERNESSIDRAVTDGLGQFPELVSDARQTLGALEMLVHRLESNPSRLLYRARQDQIELEP